MCGKGQSRSTDASIARLATSQSGVVSRAQLLALELTARQIDYRIHSGRLRPLHRGVYAVGHDAVAERGRMCAALLAVGPQAALSHWTAAVLWRLIASLPEVIELTTTGHAPKPQAGLRVYTSSALDTRIRDGLRVTTPLRTLLDLAATRSRSELERACSEALYLRLVHAEALARQRGRGSARLRAVVADTTPTRNDFERRAVGIVRAAGLPAPAVNARLGRYEVDLLWPGQRVVVELDGWEGHGHRLAFERDRARDAALQAAGYVALRFTWRQLRDEPQLVARRIAAALRRRADVTGGLRGL
jgi:very-short-patch-repair endonuclease/predicted transcriptional regulator of viral defense system